MDDIVRQALVKWPNVPHCTGWLLLDRRGNWRMRDEAAQASGAPGTPIRHDALLAFINRNYEADEHGQWFFQNGPQRVYVELGYTPWVVRLSADAAGQLCLTDHAGGVFAPSAAFLDDEGNVLFSDVAAAATATAAARIAVLHDHDLDLFSEHAQIHGAGADVFVWREGTRLVLQAVPRREVAQRFGFVASPATAQAARAG